MAFITTGLTNSGVTVNYQIKYDDSLSTADGKNRANALIAVCDTDFTTMTNWFGGISLPYSVPYEVDIKTGAGWSASWGSGPPLTLIPGNGATVDMLRFLLVSEVTEMFMLQQGIGWSPLSSSEGTAGEGLSHYLGTQLLIDIGSALRPSSLASLWLNSAREDFVNHVDPADESNSSKSACAVLFLYYLSTQLGFSATQIVGAGDPELSGVYRNLTGDDGDPFPFFKLLLDNAYPSTSASAIANSNHDDAFPVGLLSFWVDKSTFGRDEVQDVINTNGGKFSNSFWLVLEGFNIDTFNSFNISFPAFTGSFAGANGIQITPSPANPGDPTPANPIAVFEDPTNNKIPQRIRFAFDITFANLNSFPAPGADPVTFELDASASQHGSALLGAQTATVFELTGGADPYFTNYDGSNNHNVFYLSQDLRVFSTIAGQTHLGSAFTSDPYKSIRNLIGHLNSTAAYNLPSSPDPLNALPNQSGYETADTSVSPLDSGGHKKYNFALARVRLKGAAGSSATNVRVFFRLFVAQSFDTDFQPATTYKSDKGTSGSDTNKPIFPRASGVGITDPKGNKNQTIPFFATDANGSHDYDTSVTDGNIRSITIPSNHDDAWAYFGCYLDVYDSSNNSKFGGTHHCIVAEIAYDDAPIPTSTTTGTPSPENSDKLAQRNMQITSSDNPGPAESHRVPQAFDTRPSKPLALTSELLMNYPDELMIDWGNTPVGSIAHIYWPQVNVNKVLTLANKIYGTHLLSASDNNTVDCKVTKGVTYIPIPVDAGKTFAGLFTVDLPTTVIKGQEFNIVVRRITTRRPNAEKGVNHLAFISGEGQTSATKLTIVTESIVKRVRNWRYIMGTFQVKIPVTTKDVMLRPEEDTLAIMKWRLQHMNQENRWYPVIERYISYISARIDGLGGNSSLIKPSLNGVEGRSEARPEHARRYAGKISALLYGQFGDFEGFILQLQDGEHKFYSRERKIEEIANRAWEERIFVIIYTDADELHIPRLIELT